MNFTLTLIIIIINLFHHIHLTEHDVEFSFLNIQSYYIIKYFNLRFHLIDDDKNSFLIHYFGNLCKYFQAKVVSLMSMSVVKEEEKHLTDYYYLLHYFLRESH